MPVHRIFWREATCETHPVRDPSHVMSPCCLDAAFSEIAMEVDDVVVLAAHFVLDDDIVDQLMKEELMLTWYYYCRLHL